MALDDIGPCSLYEYYDAEYGTCYSVNWPDKNTMKTYKEAKLQLLLISQSSLVG